MKRSNRNSSYHEDTELILGLPGANGPEKQSSSLIVLNKKISFTQSNEESTSGVEECHDHHLAPQRKVQAIGWPPIRSYRKNCLQVTKYVKVSMDGAPYLRKIDLKQYSDYEELLKALENIFQFKEALNSGSEYKPTYEDKDGDWMLVGDVPWEMFIGSCKRLRLMKGSEAKGLYCLARNMS